ncbi:MAG: NUDIX hydrolase [Patescibacteria group bacterium]
MSRESVVLGVRAVIQRRSGKILLLQRNSDRNRDAGLWEVPGGLIEAGEPLPMALKREIKEETGLIVSPRHSEPLTFISPKTEGPRYLELIFRCQRVRGEKVRLAPDEHQDSRWVTVEAALDLKLTPTARDLLEFLLE